MVEQAIAGRSVIDTWSANSHVLTTANGTTAESRAAMLSLTDSGTALTGAGSVICPALSKVYIVKNGTAQVITVKTAAGSGIAVPVGKTMLVYCDGTDVLEAVDHVVTLSAGTLTITGLTTFASLKGTGAVTVTDILDEDNMASDSATALVTQQSVKAYVASQVGANNELSEVLANGNTTGGTDIAVSTGDDITFADNSKAIFGASDDLQIYHDGSNSYIKEDGTGNLIIAADDFRVTNVAISEVMITADTDGSVRLYHNGLSKLDTTATGIDVTGTVVADGLSIGTTADAYSAIFITSSVTGESELRMGDTDTDAGSISYTNVNDTMTFRAAAAPRLTINSTGIDVTGTVTADGLVTNTAGTSNFIAGVNAGNSIIAGGNYNTVIGDEAGTAITNASWNSALGYNALATATTGAQNVALGAYALDANTTASYNTAVGVHSLGANTTASNNTAVGYSALFANTTGAENTAVGNDALSATITGSYNTAVGRSAALLTTGDFNTAVGRLALRTNSSGSNNVAVGASALYQNTTASNNTAVGHSSLFANTTGAYNIAIGNYAVDANTTANYNIGIGYNALTSETSGGYNVAIGHAALEDSNGGSNNTGVGYGSLRNNTTGAANVAVGSGSLGANTTANNNTAVGTSSLVANTTGASNVALGTNALGANTTASNNTGLGFRALFVNTTGNNNSAVGMSALSANTTGASNAAFGLLALERNTTASNNSAFGQSSLRFNTTGANNVAIGFEALNANTTGASNTAVGTSALSANTTGANNVGVGYEVLTACTTGEGNVCMGYRAGALLTTGSSNTALGIVAMGNGTATGDTNTAVGYAALYSITSGTDNLALGRDAGRTGSPGGQVTTGNKGIFVGDETMTAAHIQIDWTVASDARDKTDFTALDLGLDFVKALAPVTYKWDKRSKYGDKSAEDYDLNAQTPDGTHKEDWLDIGFKAQEVEALEIAAGYTKDNKTNLVSSHTDDGKQMGLQYSKFVPILVKAIQEQQTLIESLTARLETLEGK